MADGEPGRPTPLDIPELLANVFDQMAEADDLPALARCARVCQAWSGRALESLWKGPIWASQLTTLLPPSTASATPFNLPRASSDPLRNQRFLLRIPTEAELARLNSYAALIEHLRFDESDAMHPWMTARLHFPKLKIFEAQPMLDLEAILTLGPLCGSQISRVLLDLDEQDEEDDDEDDEEIDDDDPDPVWGHAEQYDTAASYSLVNHVALSCPSLTTLDLCLGKKTSANGVFPLLRPLRGTLKRLSFLFPNAGGRHANPLALEGLRALDGFDALEYLEFRVEDILAAKATKSGTRPLNLPALRKVILTDLSTEQLPSFLALLPSKIEELSIFEPAVVPKYRRTDPTADFCTALRRFTSLKAFQLASHHVPPEPRNTLADLEFLKTVLVTSVLTFASLQTLRFGLGRAELPKEALVSVAQALPSLRHLALLTKDLDAADLNALSHTLPLLESLAVSAWIRLPYPPPLDAGVEPTEEARASSIATAGEWSFPQMRRFGEFSSEQSAQRAAGRRLLKDVVEQDIFFAERFPAECKFGPAHPLTEHYVDDSYLWDFQEARNGPAPDDGNFSVDGSNDDDGSVGSDGSEIDDAQISEDLYQSYLGMGYTPEMAAAMIQAGQEGDGDEAGAGEEAAEDWDGDGAGEWTDEDDGF